jgi:hypothetical protein
MHALRSALDLRSQASTPEPEESKVPNSWISDLRLFAITFAAGFLFVSILIG